MGNVSCGQSCLVYLVFSVEFVHDIYFRVSHRHFSRVHCPYVAVLAVQGGVVSFVLFVRIRLCI